MKSLRFLSTLGVLAICTVFASAQDSGLGRGHGNGSKDKDSGSKSRPETPPPSNQGRSSSSQDSGRSRDRSSEPRQPSSPPPPQDSGRSRDRSSEPRQPSSPPPTQDSGRSRDRSSEPRQPSSPPPPQDSGRSRDRTSEPRQPSSPPPPQDSGRSRDRTSDSGRGTSSQDGGLGRSQGGGTQSGGGSTRTDRGSQPRQTPPPQDGGLGRSQGGGTQSGGGTTRTDRGSQPRQTPPQDGGLGRGQGGGTQSGGGSTRTDRGSQPRQTPPQDGGLGRSQGGDQGLGRGQKNDLPIQGRVDNQPSRSGEVKYRGNNNVEGRINPKVAIIPPTTYGIIKSTSMESRARREDAPRNFNGLNYNGWRTGYCHYNSNWNDSYFWYPNYCFSPFGNVNIVISPWYSYSFLPGYLNCNHVYVNDYRGYWGWNSGVVYIQNSYDYGYDRITRNRELDYTVDDLQDGFEKRDFRALDRLVPDRGQIAIYRDGRYDYSIDTRDFADLLNDLSSNADTSKYRILETRINRNSARISASHEYYDQWGNRQRVYHSIYLEMERGDYVIREFGTSNYRVW